MGACIADIAVAMQASFLSLTSVNYPVTLVQLQYLILKLDKTHQA